MAPERLMGSAARVGAKLALGGAQLGMAYGRTNLVGEPQFDDAVALVQGAVARGVTTFDTARSYGFSEAVLGSAKRAIDEPVRIVTKLAPARTGDVAEVDASVFRSLFELRSKSLDVVLLHRASELTAHEGTIWRRLCELRDEGFVKSLGVSVQSPSELEAALNVPGVEVVQLPFNVIDRRWDLWVDGEVLSGVEVHARSAFLQGILLASTDEVWPVVAKSLAQPVLRQLDNLVVEFNRKSRADLCVAYSRSFPSIDYVVLGVDGQDQLAENLSLFDSDPLTPHEVDRVRNAFTDLPPELLDPSRWSAA